MTKFDLIARFVISGDNLPILIWQEKPAEAQLHDAYRQLLPDEYVEEDGEEYCYLYLLVQEVGSIH